MTDLNPSKSLMVSDPKPSKAAKFVAPTQWDALIWTENPIFAELNTLFPLTQSMDFPSVNTLEQWRLLLRPELTVSFVDNEKFAADGRYYETFIYDTAQVPTRFPNWHDLFGALIWCLFPKTKTLLNRLHMQEIQLHGDSHRTALRNKLTLLDECGVLVLYSGNGSKVVDLLRQHLWTEAFVNLRHAWQGQSNTPQIGAMMFGHANYEMATRPFLGLTGKILAVAVPSDYFQQSLRQRIDFIDTALSEQIANQGSLVDPLQLTPLPLLGVPGWFEANNHPDFYQNTAYFRPKPKVKVQE